MEIKVKKLLKKSKLLEALYEEKIIDKKKFEKEWYYEQMLLAFQRELVKLQSTIEDTHQRVLIIFEGRDTAGKGGVIKRITEYLDPRMVKTTALPAPTALEKEQWYFQRYLQHLPNAGEIMLFDRSWYNRAVVEPVFGFCEKEQHERFLQQVNELENMLTNDGIILMKFFLSISKEEQIERLDSRRDDPLKAWKIGKLDEQAVQKWEDYSEYIDKLFQTTATTENPWLEIITDQKKEARLTVIHTILQNFNYQDKEVPEYTHENILKVHK